MATGDVKNFRKDIRYSFICPCGARWEHELPSQARCQRCGGVGRVDNIIGIEPEAFAMIKKIKQTFPGAKVKITDA